MNVTWVNPSFADYRVPVYAALHRLLAMRGGGLRVVFSESRTGERVRRKIVDALGDRAVAMSGEKRIGIARDTENFANAGVSLPYQPGLLRAITGGRPDVIVSEGFFQWTPASLVASKRLGSALVIAYERTAHTERNASWWRTRYRQWIRRQLDAVACNGSLSREYCETVLGVAPDRIVTGAMAADSDALAKKSFAVSPQQIAEQRNVWNVSNDGPVFLYVGQFVRRKGLRELLAAWERHVSNNGRGTLVLVGDGAERDALASIIRDRNPSNVTLAGPAHYDDIARCYAAADVLVMPTLEDNWSLVVPEAMACGKPILCSTFNGCWPELVHENANGWTFDPTNAAQLAGLFGRCASSTSRLPVMGVASRNIVADFTPVRAAEAVLKSCEIALAGRTRRAAS